MKSVNQQAHAQGHQMSNFISSASDGKKTKLNNYTIQHNEMKSIDRQTNAESGQKYCVYDLSAVSYCSTG